MQNSTKELSAEQTQQTQQIEALDPKEVLKWIEDNRPRLTKLRQELTALQNSI